MFEINGKKYREIIRKPKKRDKKIDELIMIAGLYGGLTNLYSNKSDIPHCDVKKEYELIMKKKSKLSSRERAAIVRYFERNYEEVNVCGGLLGFKYYLHDFRFKFTKVIKVK